MKKLLMMVVPGVLALSISASIAMERDASEAVPGNTKTFTRSQEQQLADIVSKFVNENSPQHANSQVYTNDGFYPPVERIYDTDKIPHWVCNP